MRKIYLVIIIINIFLFSCISLEKYFPTDNFTYPNFINGYNEEIRVEITYSDGIVLNDIFTPKQRMWSHSSKDYFINIRIFDKNDNLLSEYPKVYLNSERDKKLTKNEVWVAYKGGLVLVPEEYITGDKWQEYIESLQ